MPKSLAKKSGTPEKRRKPRRAVVRKDNARKPSLRKTTRRSTGAATKKAGRSVNSTRKRAKIRPETRTDAEIAAPQFLFRPQEAESGMSPRQEFIHSLSSFVDELEERPSLMVYRAPEPEEQEERVPFLESRFGFLATIFGLLCLGAVAMTAAASAATFQGPTQAAPGGNIPVTIWNSQSSGGKQTDASLDIDGTGSFGSSTLDLGASAGGQNVLYGSAVFADMNPDDNLLLLQTSAGGTFTDRLSLNRDGNLNVGTLVVKPGSVDVLKVAAQDGSFGSTAVTIDGGNRTNQPVLRLNNIGAGDAGLYFNAAGGGSFGIDSFDGSPAMKWINKHPVFKVDNNAFDPSSPQTYLFSHVNQPASMVEFVIREQAGQTGDIQQWQNSAGTVLTTIGATGNLGIGDTTPAASLTVGDGDLFQVAGATGNVQTVGTIKSSGHVAFGANSGINDGSLLNGSTTYSTIASIEESFTNLSTNVVDGITDFVELNPSSTPIATAMSAVDAEIATKSGNTKNFSVVNGGQAVAVHNGSGNVTGSLNGLKSIAKNAGGGSVTQAAGLFTLVENVGSGTLTDGYGVYVDSAVNSGGGAFQDNYGVYISDQSSVGSFNSYNLYSQGATAQNLFEGDLTVNGLVVIGRKSADPFSAVGGTIYYNTTSNKFRCFQNIDWTDCISTASSSANNALSNLTATSINQSLVPNANNALDLGSAANGWRDLYLAGDAAVNGGDLTTTAGTFNLVNGGATTVNFAGAATNLNIGPGGGTSSSIRLAGGSGNTGCTVDGSTGNLICDGTMEADGNSFSTTSGTFNLLQSGATTINFGGAAATIAMGSGRSDQTFTSAPTVNLFNTSNTVNFATGATTANLATGAATVNLGAGGASAASVNFAGGSGATGCTVDGLTGQLSCDGALFSANGTLSVGATTANLANTTATTVNIGGAATTVNIGAASSLTSLGGSLGLGGATPSEKLTIADGGNVLLNAGSLESPYGGIGRTENYLRTSEDFSNANWVKTSVTVTANAATGPDTTSTADQLASTAANATVQQSAASAGAGLNTTWTGSVWLRTSSGTATVTLRVDTTFPLIGDTPSTKTVTTSWQRFSVQQNFTVNNASPVLTILFPNSGTTVFAWGGQLERQANTGVYLRTDSAAVTTTRLGLVGDQTLSIGGTNKTTIDTNGNLSLGGTNIESSNAGTIQLFVNGSPYSSVSIGSSANTITIGSNVTLTNSSATFSRRILPATFGPNQGLRLPLLSTGTSAPSTQTGSGEGDILYQTGSSAGIGNNVFIQGTYGANTTFYGLGPYYLGDRRGIFYTPSPLAQDSTAITDGMSNFYGNFGNFAGGFGRIENYLVKSEDFSDSSSWTRTLINSVTADNALAPNGTLTADTVAGSASSSSLSQVISGTSPANQYWTCEVWAKAVSGNPTVSLQLVTSGAISARSFAAPTLWERQSISIQFPSGGVSGNTSFNIVVGANSVLLWGASCQNKPNASPYMKTTSTAVTTPFNGLAASDARIVDTLGIGTPTVSSGYKLEVNGSAAITGGGTFTATGDVVATFNAWGTVFGPVTCPSSGACACPNGYYVGQIINQGQQIYCYQL